MTSSSSSSSSSGAENQPPQPAAPDDDKVVVTKKKDDDEQPLPLTPERVAELVEVSFVNGILQLAKGYVDVLKLFIVAVQSGYALGMTLENLLEAVAQCPAQSANRPLMDDEVQLRTAWIQVVYLVLDHVQYQHQKKRDNTNNNDDNKSNAIYHCENAVIDDDNIIQKTYAGIIPILVQAKEEGESFEANKMLQMCAHLTNNTNNDDDDPLEKAILSQSLRVIWLTLTVLEEEAQCLEDKQPVNHNNDKPPPPPPIPGAFQ